jgi:hypothetical protein
VLIHYRNKPIVAQWNNPPSVQALRKLNQVEYFRRAHDENGFAVEEFDEIPSLIENMDSFQMVFRDMIDYVGSFL